MGLFKKSGTPAPTANFSTNFKLISGIPGWAENFFVIKAELCPDKITFYQSPIGNAKTVSLSYEQITGTDVYSETEILEKSKSVIARSVAGAALFGPLGAIIGGMSGVGSKKSKKTSYYYTISYTTSNGDPGLLTFGTDCMGCNYYMFDHLLKEMHLSPKNSSNEEPEFL